MSKYIIKNCPSLGWSKRTFKMCKCYLENNKPSKCSDVESCMPKKIYNIVKKYEHDCSCCDELLKNIDIEEVNE